jgi:hypothetical protein
VAKSRRPFVLGEEFTDFILVDEKRNSVILNIKADLFKTVYREYKKLGYTLKHVTRFKDNTELTCVFIKELEDK